MLSEYGSNGEAWELINSRDIYIVPVVSPDTYPDKRWVDGVDPNRNFPHPNGPDTNTVSVPPVQALQDLYNKHKFDAVISGHTSGRVFFFPWGDQQTPCPDHDTFEKILKPMFETSGYTVEGMTSAYGRPIYGTASDWYYRQGAFAICMEFGTVMGVPPSKEYVENEFKLTYKAALYFIKVAPEVELIGETPTSIPLCNPFLRCIEPHRFR
jgi:hypothetical protein